MKSLKKAILTGVLSAIAISTMSICSKAATVKVTAETLNIRKGPSTSTDVIAMLSENVECELLEEDGDWYKVKYKNYTGYVSKQYVKLVGETPTNEENVENNNSDTQDNNSTNTENNNTENNNSENKNEVTVNYKKVNQNTDIKLLPLIHSSNIGSLKSGSQVTFINSLSGWSYIQTNDICGWVRNDVISEETVTTSQTSQSSEKTAYINENYVNLRKGAGTSNSIIKVLSLNTQITITGEEGEWYKVKAGNDTGYVLKEYVSDKKTVTSRNNPTSRVEEKDEVQVISTSKDEDSLKDKTTSTNNNESKTTNSATTSEPATTTSNKESQTDNKTKGTDVIAYAQKYLGYKYVYGGDGSNGTFDCSGFTMYVFKHFGISLAHGANAQYNSGKGKKISKQSDLQTGDIVFLTDYETGKGIGHCGIYISNGNFIHASTTTYTVTISSLNTMYKGRFYAGLRLI